MSTGASSTFLVTGSSDGAKDLCELKCFLDKSHVFGYDHCVRRGYQS